VKKFKKIIGLLLIAAMIPACCACDGGAEEKDGKATEENGVVTHEKSAEAEVDDYVEGEVEPGKKPNDLENAKEIRLGYIDKIQDAAEMSREDEMDMTAAYKRSYEKTDKILNELYGYLKTLLSEDEFKELEADEQRWIQEKESAASARYDEYMEMFDETYAEEIKQCTLFRYTEKRCYYLVMFIGASAMEDRLSFAEDFEDLLDELDVPSDAMTQMEMNQESAEEYSRLKDFYDDVYAYHKKNMTKDDFAQFEDEEADWQQERQNATDEEYASYQGGSIAPLMANILGCSMTESRCYYLMAIID